MRAVTLADTLPAVRWRPVWRGVAPKRLSSEFPVDHASRTGWGTDGAAATVRRPGPREPPARNGRGSRASWRAAGRPRRSARLTRGSRRQGPCPARSRAGRRPRIPARPVSDVAAWRDVPGYRSEAAAVRVGGLGPRLRGQSVSPPRPVVASPRPAARFRSALMAGGTIRRRPPIRERSGAPRSGACSPERRRGTRPVRRPGAGLRPRGGLGGIRRSDRRCARRWRLDEVHPARALGQVDRILARSELRADP